jgi:hypothetical protein
MMALSAFPSLEILELDVDTLYLTQAHIYSELGAHLKAIKKLQWLELNTIQEPEQCDQMVASVIGIHTALTHLSFTVSNPATGQPAQLQLPLQQLVVLSNLRELKTNYIMPTSHQSLSSLGSLTRLELLSDANFAVPRLCLPSGLPLQVLRAPNYSAHATPLVYMSLKELAILSLEWPEMEFLTIEHEDLQFKLTVARTSVATATVMLTTRIADHEGRFKPHCPLWMHPKQPMQQPELVALDKRLTDLEGILRSACLSTEPEPQEVLDQAAAECAAASAELQAARQLHAHDGLAWQWMMILECMLDSCRQHVAWLEVGLRKKLQAAEQQLELLKEELQQVAQERQSLHQGVTIELQTLEVHTTFAYRVNQTLDTLPYQPGLKTLFFGLTHPIGSDHEAVKQALQLHAGHLEDITLHLDWTSDTPQLPAALPECKRLSIQACSMTLQHLKACALPKLEALELLLPMGLEVTDVSARALAAALRDCGALRRLRMCVHSSRLMAAMCANSKMTAVLAALRTKGVEVELGM